MSVSPISAHGSPGVDLVALFNTHVGYHDQRDINAKAVSAASAAPVAVVNAAPLSAALAHPTRRPAFLAVRSARRGRNAGGAESNRHLARGDRGDEAELQSWDRMEPGERGQGPIPGNNRLELPVQPESVHGRRIGSEQAGQARKAAQSPGMVSQLTSAAGMLARRAALERARFLMPLGLSLTGSPWAAAA